MSIWNQHRRHLAAFQLQEFFHAGIYDLGAIAIAFEAPLPHATSWEAVGDLLASAQDPAPHLLNQFVRTLDELEAALLGEQRPVRAGAVSLTSSLSYYPDDLALLSWNGAVLIESDPLAATTAADLLEYANVQLLRTYDASLDADLPRMYQRMAIAQRRFTLPFVRRYSRL